MSNYKEILTTLTSLNIPFRNPCDPNYVGDCTLCQDNSVFDITNIAFNNVDNNPDETQICIDYTDSTGTPQQRCSIIATTIDNQEAPEVPFDPSCSTFFDPTDTNVALALCKLAACCNSVTTSTVAGETPFTNAPTNPTENDPFINITDGTHWIYNGITWVEIIDQDDDAGNYTEEITGGFVLQDPILANPIAGDQVVQTFTLSNDKVISTYDGTNWNNIRIRECCIDTANISASITDPTDNTEVATYIAAQGITNQLVYVIGTGSNTDPQYVWFVDTNGIPTNIESPLEMTALIFDALETQNVNFNTGTNLPLPLATCADSGRIAIVDYNNGTGYFQCDGTNWVLSFFNEDVTVVIDVHETINSDFNIGTNTPLPTIACSIAGTKATVNFNNGLGYFSCDGTNWTLDFFKPDPVILTDIHETSVINYNIGTNTPLPTTACSNSGTTATVNYPNGVGYFTCNGTDWIEDFFKADPTFTQAFDVHETSAFPYNEGTNTPLPTSACSTSGITATVSYTNGVGYFSCDGTSWNEDFFISSSSSQVFDVNEVISGNYNTGTNTPLPTATCNTNGVTATVSYDNGVGYFTCDGTNWVENFFVPTGGTNTLVLTPNTPNACETPEVDIIFNGSSVGTIKEGQDMETSGTASVTGNYRGPFQDVNLRGNNDAGQALNNSEAGISRKTFITENLNGCVLEAGVRTEDWTDDTLWVDAVYGNDATARPYRRDLPYATIEAAWVDSDRVDDTIVLLGGDYQEAGNTVVAAAGEVLNMTSIGRSIVSRRFSATGGEMNFYGSINFLSDATGRDGRILYIGGLGNINVESMVDTRGVNGAMMTADNSQVNVTVNDSIGFYQTSNGGRLLLTSTNTLDSQTGAVAQAVTGSTLVVNFVSSLYTDARRGAFTAADSGTTMILNGISSTSTAEDNVIVQSGATVHVLGGRYICSATNGTAGNPRAPFYLVGNAGETQTLITYSGVTGVQLGNTVNAITATGAGTHNIKSYGTTCLNLPIQPTLINIIHGTYDVDANIT